MLLTDWFHTFIEITPGKIERTWQTKSEIGNYTRTNTVIQCMNAVQHYQHLWQLITISERSDSLIQCNNRK